MSTLRPEFDTSLVNKSINDIFYRRSNFYYFLGKVNSWQGATPSDIPNTCQNDTLIRDNILYLKRVSPNDASIVTPKYLWTSKVWDQWDHTLDMSTKQFYCINSQYNVYKCLNNNNGGISTTEPQGTSLGVISTSDGYLWKYLYNVPSFKRTKFIDNSYIPVQKAITDTFYSKGAVSQVMVNNGGSGYTSNPQTTIVAVGGTTGDTAILIPSINSNGEIVKVTIARAGTNYTTAPTLTVNQVGNSGIGKYGNPSAKLKAIIYNGSVVNVTIEDPGINYPRDISTQINVTGDGIGASFIPVIYNGVILDVIIDNPGYGYSNIKLTVTGVGSSASVSAILAQSDFVSDQSYVEQSIVQGAIYSIKVTEQGNNYSNNTTISIIGDGTGATASPIIQDGKVTSIYMTSYGVGYTYANVVIRDSTRPINQSNIDATCYAILPPINGHGYDCVKELYADTLCIYTNIKDDTELNLLSQDYRQYGLLKDPLDIQTNRKINNSSALVVFTISLDSTTNIEIDSILLNNNTRYRVISKTSNTVLLQQNSSIYKTPQGILISESNPSNTWTIRNVLLNSTANKYSGDLLYTSNTDPLIPSGQQSIVVRSFIKL